MEAQSLATVGAGPPARNRGWEPLGRVTWLATLGSLGILCLFLFTRRLCGAFQYPLSTGGLIAVALAAAATASLLRSWADRIRPPAHAALWGWARLAGPSGCLLLLAVSLSLSASPPAGLGSLWFVLLSVEACWWCAGRFGGFALRRSVPLRSPGATDRPDTPTAQDSPERHAPPPETVEETPDEDEIDDVLPVDVTQQLTRRRDADGRDAMFGYLRGVFAPGERSQNLHVAFCPPFEGTPVLAVHQVSGPPTTIKLAQVETYGARLELKLASKSSQAENVVVHFDVRWEPVTEVPAVDFPS